MAVAEKLRSSFHIEEYGFQLASFEQNILLGPFQPYKPSSYG